MSPASVSVRVPATSANLGPGFDCLAIALDLWNVAEFTPGGKGFTISVEGEGQGQLPLDQSNAIAGAFLHFLRAHDLSGPDGVTIRCQNAIPPSSGLGSSAAALLLGMLGANALNGSPASLADILSLAADLEGHADNTAAALYGGLTLSIRDEQGWLVRHYDTPAWQVAFVLPAVNLPTHTARAALPASVSREHAIYNLGRTSLVVDALRQGDSQLLGRAMRDCLHQPQRLKLIPGAEAAMQAAMQAGASAVALSGAGPSLIAFGAPDTNQVGAAMQAAFERAGVAARTWYLHTTGNGAEVFPI